MKDKIKLFGVIALVGFGVNKAVELATKIGRIECANDIEQKIKAEQNIKFPSGQVMAFTKHTEDKEES